MSLQTMDALDRELLNLLQENIPLVPRPYQALAERLGTTEADVLRRVAELKKTVVRQISAIFDTRALGYASSLVAARVKPELVDKAAQVINEHPGVSHNYKRNHAFNLWFTIAVPPNSRFGLEKTVEILGKRAPGVESIRLLPTLKLFKIGVQLDVTGKEDTSKAKAKPTYTDEDRKNADSRLSDLDIAMVRELQKDLPVTERPFDEWAQNIGITTEELLAGAESLKQRKLMRRFSAVLRHRQAGFLFNGMGVWNVPDDKVEEVGPKMAAFKAVSHCYLRPRYEDWPYNIFTMVHGRSLEECEAILKAIEEETGITDRIVLYSTKEYKKTRVEYFTPETYDWEAKVAEELGL